ncbi:MAG: HDOD domain-containing protein [Gammaproteobacteria bacterium]|uniref:HDOD domain-containing protein n=1 Tax=Rhodoferax sp. TaxID=50421 RepID=UPI001826D4C9|nr:HDOD domain-containing protein [Rhodoferax sp.]MBU3899028.1 HDOD domain-containing protein [Gammaproteobacteria bacterium]MBA3057672.1 HDOD domain-containing protein [Rhodoferax sp.]MBU3998246.1 HDOD domain-containing protein [Gammaproteobacteria bacterium]MBU4018471.1 HDOD domain-containing protein [Gammaproteobacteria bacterium]MBU4080483.1 HDOD domain-containing protein [Gammaproteobacteria bacterium]
MSPELSLKLAAAVDGMPAFPKSVQKILELTRDVNCSPKDLVQVIDKDPVVTVKVLRVVNSAYYSLPKQITSINHAVVYLGFNTIKNLALSIAAIGMLPASNAAGFDGAQYLIHSLSTAAIAKQLALRVDDADPMDCFIAGLLHDFGKVVFAQFMPVEFRKALETSQWNESSLHLALRELIGADHAVVGAMLVEKWRFPADLVETIRCQYGPEVKDTPMIACVFAANQISKKLEFGFAGNCFVEELPPAIAQRLGGTLDELIVSLGDLAPLLEEAKIFSKV